MGLDSGFINGLLIRERGEGMLFFSASIYFWLLAGMIFLLEECV